MNFMIKQILQLAYPVVGSRLVNVLLEVITVFIVASIGVSYLAAYGLTTSFYLAIYMIFMSYLLVFSVKAAKLQDYPQKLSLYLSDSIIFALILSVVVCIILLILPSILPYLGQSPKLVYAARGFFYFITLGMPAVFLTSIMNQALIVFSRSFVVMMSAVIQLIVGIIIIYLFTHIFHLGLKGVALGFVFSYWLRFFMVLPFFLKMDCVNLDFSFRSFSEIKQNIFFLVNLGWPVSLQYGGEIFAGSISVLMIGHLYPNALAAQQLTSQLRILFIMIPYGLSQALTIMVAQHKSSEDSHFKNYLTNLVKKVFVLSFSIMIVTVLVMNIARDWYIGRFLHTSNMHLIHLANVFIVILSIAILFDTVKYILMGLLRGLGNTKGSMRYTLIFYYLIGIPAAYLLGYTFNAGPIGVRVGMLIGLAVSVVAIVIYSAKFVSAHAETG